MKKYRLSLYLAAIFGLLTMPAKAQNLETAHFLDNYIFSYRLNPSVTPYLTSGFFTVGAGNITITPNLNVGMSNFFFPVDGKLVTGFHKSVSYDTFIGPLPDRINFGADISENIVSWASTSKKGVFRNFEVNFVTKDHFSLPKEMFQALKPNPDNPSTESIVANDINLSSTNYLEIAIGRTWRPINLFSFGIRLKGLVGLADIKMDIDNYTFTPNFGEEKIDISGKGTFIAAATPLTIPTNSSTEYIFQNTRPSPGIMAKIPTSYGAALDAGVNFYLWQNRIQLGASLHDLGFLSWKTDKYGKMEFTESVSTDNLDGKEMIGKLLRFKKEEVPEEITGRKMLPSYYNVSVKVKPIQLVTLGAVANITTYDGNTDFAMRYGLAFTPFRQFNIAASYTGTKAAQSVGLAASVRLFGINVYAGIDSFFKNKGDGFKPMTFSPQYIPIDPIQTTINAGVAIVFGHSKERAAEIAKTKVKSKKVKEKEQEESLEDLEVMQQEEPKPLSKAEARKAEKERAKS